jgi:pimeloyl-ACP methyl ester carboxylesterase
MPFAFPVTEHVVKTKRHTTAYLACGAPDAPLIGFVHGWPDLSIGWRHQLPAFAALGFHCVAPDMRGYGRSSVYGQHSDYAVEHSVRDMMELLDSLGREKAVWVGHDWGSEVVWDIASHHPNRCHGVANSCVPYLPKGFSPQNVLPLVDKALYPEDKFPAGQWDYQLFYQENFSKACAVFEADTRASVKVLFRKGDAAARGQPAMTALIRRSGGWFGGADRAPDVPIDADVLTEVELAAYTAAFQRNGFFGPNSWYMNHERNVSYSATALNDGRLGMPVLFLHAANDFVCDTTASRLAEPMRDCCKDLTEVVIRSGHWMAQECPVAVNAALATWLALKLPNVWID